MLKIEYISMEQAKAMSYKKLQYAIGRRAEILEKDFVGGLLNLGVAMDEEMKRKKTEEK